MKNQIEAIGLIATKSAELEEHLRKAGATGIGLKELSESVQHLFDESTVSRIRKVYELRNKAMHEHGFSIDQGALDRYVANVESVIHILEPRPGSAAYFRQKMSETDYVDDEMYEWLKEEAARRTAERQAQKAEASFSVPQPKAVSADQGKVAVGTMKGVASHRSIPPAVKEAAKDAALTLAVRAVFSFIK